MADSYIIPLPPDAPRESAIPDEPPPPLAERFKFLHEEEREPKLGGDSSVGGGLQQPRRLRRRYVRGARQQREINAAIAIPERFQYFQLWSRPGGGMMGGTAGGPGGDDGGGGGFGGGGDGGGGDGGGIDGGIDGGGEGGGGEGTRLGNALTSTFIRNTSSSPRL